MPEYKTFDEALEALAAAERDVQNDMGEEALEACYHDVVDIVAQFCTPEVERELRQFTGCEQRAASW